MKNTEPHVLMAAAECRDLAKVDELGGVVRDLAKALAHINYPGENGRSIMARLFVG